MAEDPPRTVVGWRYLLFAFEDHAVSQWIHDPNLREFKIQLSFWCGIAIKRREIALHLAGKYSNRERHAGNVDECLKQLSSAGLQASHKNRYPKTSTRLAMKNLLVSRRVDRFYTRTKTKTFRKRRSKKSKTHVIC
ncbi:MAG: hypothetical protein ACR2PG_05935 [Hyphomicrobiaceae bacterium]